MYWNWGFPASTYDPGVATGSAGACAGAAVGLADGAGAEIVDGAPLEPDESPLFAAASGLLDCGGTAGGLDAGTAGAAVPGSLLAGLGGWWRRWTRCFVALGVGTNYCAGSRPVPANLNGVDQAAPGKQAQVLGGVRGVLGGIDN